eukprot:726751-Pleurochrysis_carterae.AAC.3
MAACGYQTNEREANLTAKLGHATRKGREAPMMIACVCIRARSWFLPLAGALCGYLTNWIALWVRVPRVPSKPPHARLALRGNLTRLPDKHPRTLRGVILLIPLLSPYQTEHRHRPADVT